MKGLWLMAPLVLLAGCGHWQTGEDAPFVRWKCASDNDIAWRYANAAKTEVDLKVGSSERAYRLRREPSTYGTFYSDGVLAFHDKGAEALVYRVADDELLAYGCSASLINL
ncbi:MliC family protein [Stutzerimonas azotifigens]|uniref:MliC family protein n=1 Tax=Stutzerimonas azotifigens TaxID=291995 RepID=UPI0003FA9662|nr:MliC family protein [Stutzerimonas azotifigens]